MMATVLTPVAFPVCRAGLGEMTFSAVVTLVQVRTVIGGVQRSPLVSEHGADSSIGTKKSSNRIHLLFMVFPSAVSKTATESRSEKRVLGDAFGPLLPCHLDVSEKV